MMSKFNFLLGAILLFTLTHAKAQTASTEAINGTPYVDEKYEEGVIYYGDKSLTVPVRYNAYQDLIEYTQNGKAAVLDPTLTIKRIKVGASTYITQEYKANGKTKVGYFQLLDSGRLTLLAKQKVIYLPAKKGGNLDGSDQLAQFKRNPDMYYYKIEGGAVQDVESIKSLIETLPDKQDELTQFAKKEKISPRKEKEMIQFVQYYNSLQGLSDTRANQ